LSGGEIQRLAFIRSIINDPDLILLDEPTSAPDKKNEIKLFQFLSSIKNDKIIIVATHNKDCAKYFDKFINI
jgi:ABC-type lipoprotein export system ATPase subunit